MRPPPEAVRESMEAARLIRVFWGWGQVQGPPLTGEETDEAQYAAARRQTRAILEALRAARRNETTLVERWGVK